MSRPPGNLARWGRRRRLPLLALALAAATGAGLLVASPWQRPGPAPPTVERALAAVLDAGAPGLVAQVQDGARSWTEAKGLASLGRRAPMRPADRFRIASLTKTYVAAVTLQLVAERRLGLDDPVARYLPGLLRDDSSRITVRQLLNHTSGLADTASLPAVRDAWDTGAIPPRTQVRLADAEPRRFAPGAGRAYTNTGYLVLGLLIERLTGHDLGRVLAARLFRPLHLTATSFEPQPGIPAGIAHGYRPGFGVGAVDVTESVGGGAWAAGAIVSTAGDVARFYAALLSGRVLPPPCSRRCAPPSRPHNRGTATATGSASCASTCRAARPGGTGATCSPTPRWHSRARTGTGPQSSSSTGSPDPPWTTCSPPCSAPPKPPTATASPPRGTYAGHISPSAGAAGPSEGQPDLAGVKGGSRMAARLARDRMVIRLQYGVKSGLRPTGNEHR